MARKEESKNGFETGGCGTIPSEHDGRMVGRTGRAGHALD